MFVIVKGHENQPDNQVNGKEERVGKEAPMGSGEGHLGNMAGCCVHTASLLFLLRLCVELVWFAVVGECLMGGVATSLPTPDPLCVITGGMASPPSVADGGFRTGKLGLLSCLWSEMDWSRGRCLQFPTTANV